MILFLVSRTQTLGVQYKHFNGLSIGREAIDRRAPDPHSLSAGVDRVANIEASIAVKNHSIEEVAFS